MKAMIFAAGLGTRLQPLTNSIPKALIPVSGKPLLEHVILKLKEAGFDEIIINVHHFPDMVLDFLEQNNNFGIRIEVSDERDVLLNTGGAIKKAGWFFDDGKPFLVHNVDILSNIDLANLYHCHAQSGSLATLVVSKRDTFRYLLFDENNFLRGWKNELTGETRPKHLEDATSYTKLAFAGIQILSPEVLTLMESYPDRFPIMDFYLSNANKQKIHSCAPSGFKMMDVGKLETLHEADSFFAAIEENSGNLFRSPDIKVYTNNKENNIR